jgi:hypothetical protein
MRSLPPLPRFTVVDQVNVQPEAVAFVRDPEGTWVLWVDANLREERIKHLEDVIEHLQDPDDERSA